MSDSALALDERVGRVVVDVVHAAARDARRARLAIVDADSPEGRLLARWLAAMATPLPRAPYPGADALALNPANKTVAVLWPELLREPVLPLADLYATQVRAFAGDWSAPPAARELIERAGGIDAVDAFLRQYLDERRPLDQALAAVADADAAAELRDRLRHGWWWRRRLGVVPKLGARTLGIDLR